MLATFSDMCPEQLFLDPCSRAIFDGENTDRDEYSAPVGNLARPIFGLNIRKKKKKLDNQLELNLGSLDPFLSPYHLSQNFNKKLRRP